MYRNTKRTDNKMEMQRFIASLEDESNVLRETTQKQCKDEATPKVDVVTYSPEHVLKMLGWENVDWDEVVRNMYLD